MKETHSGQRTHIRLKFQQKKNIAVINKPKGDNLIVEYKIFTKAD